MTILLDQIWPQDIRITVEVLTDNVVGYAFWAEMGFTPYSLAMEMRPSLRLARKKE